jgi:NAD(P)-dependent dehydrogenase (short-subunit alcohol dehydrogenase family)
MSEALCWEATPTGIRVHVIEPGRFPTTEFGANIVRPDGCEGSEFEAKTLRTLVGADAEMIVGATLSMSFEDFEDALDDQLVRLTTLD